MEKIKVVHVVHSFLKGGIESFLYYLTDEQKRNPNLDITILCCEDRDKILNERIVNNGIKCYFVSIQALTLSVKKLRYAYNVCKHADVIHFQIFLPVLSTVLQFTKAKKVYTIHNSGVALRAKDVKKSVKEKLFKFYINHGVDTVVSNSYYTQRFWFPNKQLVERKNVVVYNGVPPILNLTNPQSVIVEYPQLANCFIVGTSSRFISWKRISLLVQAFAMVKCNNLMLLLVGEGPEVNAIKLLVEELQISKRVVFAGYRSNVADFQDAMDMCVFPSVSEPFGLVGIECLRLGKPIVVMSDGGGLPEIVSQFEPDNVVSSIEQLADRIEYYAGDRNALQENKQLRIAQSQRYSNELAEQNYFQIYKSTLQLN